MASTKKIGRSSPAPAPTPSRAVLWLPVAFASALAAFSTLAVVQASPRLMWSILGAAAALACFAGIVALRARGRSLSLEVALRAQHYLQACAQSTVLLYWGYYWPPVYDAIPLIAAQLMFAYAFDMLLAWSRRDAYTFGFAPFPVIFSINLFLWFRADWFFLQFLMIAIGFAAKELIRWERDRRQTHIFNPSSFPLALVSVVLIATGTTSWTWGEQIATTQFNPPNIYVLLFLVGLPGQLLFGVTTMTMSAVVTTYVFGLIYFWVTGTYFFVDSYIPIAVFLGMHLLFTDPSTSPRTEVGRIVFGMIYGLSNVVLYAAFGAFGIPKFYDKLLPVPFMNLSVRLIDRLAPRLLGAVDPAQWGKALTGRKRNLAYVTLWVVAFVLMSAVDGVGDNHPGHKVPFWENACRADRADACDVLDGILRNYCQDGSGWACNQRGVLRAQGRVRAGESLADFSSACAAGFQAGCENVELVRASRPPREAPPQLADYPVILRTGKGALPDRTPAALFTRACDQGFMAGCSDLAGVYLQGRDRPRDPARARALLEQACSAGVATACSNLGYMHQSGDGVPQDVDKGIGYLKKGCDLGFERACTWLAEHEGTPRTAARP